MSVGLFLLGSLMMVFGVMAVWKTDFFLRNFGDIGSMLGFFGASWASWKVVGSVFILLGFLIAFNLLGLFFEVTLGRLFTFGQR